jgi:hypothetical protein
METNSSSASKDTVEKKDIKQKESGDRQIKSRRILEKRDMETNSSSASKDTVEKKGTKRKPVVESGDRQIKSRRILEKLNK